MVYVLVTGFFERYIIPILFLYGLSFFSFGLVILFQLRPSNLKIVKALPWLAAYGITHAMHEWGDMFRFIYKGLGSNIYFQTWDLFILTASVFFLLIFGIVLLSKITGKNYYFILLFLVIFWLTINIPFAFNHTPVQWLSHYVNTSRYIFYFSGSIISAIALTYEYFDLKKQGLKHIGKNFLYVAFAFYVNAFFGGLIGEYTPFFPENLISDQIFLSFFHFPVELIRGFIALFIAFFIIRGLEVFDFEEEQKVRNLRDRERDALDKSERLAKQFSIMYQQQKHISTTLQKSLLPLKIPHLKMYNIGVHYRSATIEAAVGGDFYDFIESNGKELFIVLGDVSGKGIKAATDTGNVKSILRYLLLSESNPSKVLSELNNALFDEFKAAKFFTVVLIHYDIEKQLITLVNAGHPPALVYNMQLKSFTWLRESGAALAVIKDEFYPETVLKADESDLLVFYTDGLTEARKNGNFFGEDGVMNTIDEIKEQSAQAIADNLVRKAVSYSGNILFDDVLTLVIKKQEG